MSKYILSNRKPVLEPNIFKWARWFESHAKTRVVCQTRVWGFFVSTVFLGLDYSFSKRKVPVLFETMIFDDRIKVFEENIVRYAFWEQAEEGHKLALKKIKSLPLSLKVKNYLLEMFVFLKLYSQYLINEVKKALK